MRNFKSSWDGAGKEDVQEIPSHPMKEAYHVSNTKVPYIGNRYPL